MKEYSGYDTKVNGLLLDDLRKTNGINTIYVSHYFFALNDGKELIFYYNPMHYWDKLPIEKVDNTVWINLENECAVFRNFNPDEETKITGFGKETKHTVFFPETPRIGNHYSFLGNRVVSHHRYFYFLGDMGGCFKVKTKDLSINAINHLLHIAVLTKTPYYIKSVYNLDCFKNIKNDSD